MSEEALKFTNKSLLIPLLTDDSSHPVHGRLHCRSLTGGTWLLCRELIHAIELNLLCIFSAHA